MTLLNGINIKKAFSGETLFDNVSFSVYGEDKIGFVGVNGAGKSTLFNIIAGRLEADGGELFRGRETRIGYLEQYTLPDGDVSVMDEMLTVFSEVIGIEEQIEDIRAMLERGEGDADALVVRQAALRERFFALGGSYYRSRIKSALAGLGFSESDLSTPVSRLSGGQKTRVALCKILLSDANLLLLDEPTNHLDIDSVEWLEEFLIDYKGAFIVVSHDRYFLDRATTKTFELENKRFRAYDGGYTAYMAQREIERLTQQRTYDYTVGEIARLEEVIEQQRRWKHKKNKKTHTLDNTRKAIERLEKNLVEPDKTPEAMRFTFRACAGGAQRVLEAEDLAMGFGGAMLFEHVDLRIKKGEKVFLLGPNGCGKTTLLKLIMGLYEARSGSLRVGDNVRIGYYDQLKENVHRDKTVIDEVWDEHRTLPQTELRSALALFLFKGEDVFKSVGALSGGELARVELAKLLLSSVNFLVLDEPTNHLDIASREALESALGDYDGTVLAVSHDRYFINRLADRILYLTPTGVICYDGDYDEYLAGRSAAKDTHEKKPAGKGAADYKEKKRLEAERRKTLNRHARVEAHIAELENRIAELTRKYEAPEIASDYVRLSELLSQIDALRQELDQSMTEWEALQLTVDRLDGREEG